MFYEGSKIEGNGGGGGGGSSVEIDNSTITKNSSDEIQAVGLVNQNTDAGATTPLKLWNGTEQQWESGGGTATYYEWSTASEVSSSNYIPYPYPQPDTPLNWKVAGGIGSDTVIAITPGSAVDARIDSKTGGYSSSSDLSNNPHHIVRDKFDGRFLVYPEVFEGGVSIVYYTDDNGQTWQQTGMNGVNTTMTPIEVKPIGDSIIAFDGFNPFVYRSTGFAAPESWDTISTMFPIDKMFVGTNDCLLAHAPAAMKQYVWSNVGFGNIVELNNPNLDMFILSDLYTYANPNFIIIGERDGDKVAIFGEAPMFNVVFNSVSLPNYTYTSIASIGSKVVLLAGNKAVYSSNSGATWSEATISSTNTYGKVHAAGDKFVVMGTNCVAYSYDMANWVEFALPATHTDFSYTANSAFAATDNGFVIIPTCPNTPTGEPETPFVTYANCFTTETNPTTASTVYSTPGTISAKTITSVGTGTITLSDNNNYTLDGQSKSVSSSIGDTHPDYLCNINGVGVKIGNTVIADKNSSSGWTGMFNAEGGRMIHVVNGLIVRVEPDF